MTTQKAHRGGGGSSPSTITFCSIPTDVIANIIFQFLPLDSVLDLRLVSVYCKNLVDMKFWLRRPFLLNPNHHHEKKSLYRFLTTAAITCCQCFDHSFLSRAVEEEESAEEGPSPKSDHKPPRIFKNESVFSQISTFWIENEPEESITEYKKIPKWMYPRIEVLKQPSCNMLLSCMDGAKNLKTLEITTRFTRHRFSVDSKYLIPTIDDVRVFLKTVHCSTQLQRFELCQLCHDHDNEPCSNLFEFDWPNMKNLRVLVLKRRGHGREALHLESPACIDTFPLLEVLCVKGHYEFSNIVKFPFLHTLGLFYIPTLSTVQNFPSLKDLHVSSCAVIESVEDCLCLETLRVTRCPLFSRTKNLPNVKQTTLLEIYQLSYVLSILAGMIGIRTLNVEFMMSSSLEGRR